MSVVTEHVLNERLGLVQYAAMVGYLLAFLGVAVLHPLIMRATRTNVAERLELRIRRDRARGGPMGFDFVRVDKALRDGQVNTIDQAIAYVQLREAFDVPKPVAFVIKLAFSLCSFGLVGDLFSGLFELIGNLFDLYDKQSKVNDFKERLFH